MDEGEKNKKNHPSFIQKTKLSKKINIKNIIKNK